MFLLIFVWTTCMKTSMFWRRERRHVNAQAQVCLGQSRSGYNELNREFICRPSQFSVCSDVDCNWPRPLTWRGQGSGIDLRGREQRSLLLSVKVLPKENVINCGKQWLQYWPLKDHLHMNRQSLSQSLTALQLILVNSGHYDCISFCFLHAILLSVGLNCAENKGIIGKYW